MSQLVVKDKDVIWQHCWYLPRVCGSGHRALHPCVPVVCSGFELSHSLEPGMGFYARL